MIHEETWIVTSEACRPARPDGCCFYCSVPVGGEHAEDCVLRRRTVVVESTIRWVTDVPEDWDAHDVEFYLNESSSCADNIVRRLFARLNDSSTGPCYCGRIDSVYIGEATEEDEEAWGRELLNIGS